MSQCNRNVSGITINMIQAEERGTGCKVIYERLRYFPMFIIPCTEYLVYLRNLSYKVFVLG